MGLIRAGVRPWHLGHIYLMASTFGFRVKMSDEVPSVIGLPPDTHCEEVTKSGFSHAMFVDQVTENTIVPLNDNLPTDGRLELANSELK
jgi:hypothetical protein